MGWGRRRGRGSWLIPTLHDGRLSYIFYGAIESDLTPATIYTTWRSNGEGIACQGNGCYHPMTGGGISPYPPETIVPPADPLSYVPKPQSPVMCPTGRMPPTFTTRIQRLHTVRTHTPAELQLRDRDNDF